MSAATTAAIAGVGISAYSAYKSGKAQDAQVSAANSAAQAAQGQQSATAKSLSDYSQQQFKLSQPALSAGMGYYQKLLTGDRSQVQQAIAPDVAGINSAYEGTQKYLTQQGVQGGARDNAIAESERQRVGQIGMLPFMARQAAASSLTQAGLAGTGQALSGMGAAAGANLGAGQLANANSQTGFYQGQVRGQQIQGLGSNIAGLFANWLRGNQTSGGTFPTGGNITSGPQIDL